MKKILVFCLAAVGLSAFAAGCWTLKETAPEETVVLEGIGQGYRGPIRVAVETTGEKAVGLSGKVILNVEILDHEEDEFTGAEAMRELLDLIIETGSTDLDAISGATESSKGFLEAVENALQTAGY